MSKQINVGVIGGGLMGREVASAFGRWFALSDSNVNPALVAVADVNNDALSWFESVSSCTILTGDYKELLQTPDIDVVYVAVPHKASSAATELVTFNSARATNIRAASMSV